MSDLGNVEVVNVLLTHDFGTRPGDIYIGRQRRNHKTPSRLGEKMNRAGAFVNPYPYGETVFEREEAIEKYELDHLFGTTNASQFIPQLSQVDRNIRIGCVCKPKKCSGDILKYYLLEYRKTHPHWEEEVETGRPYDDEPVTEYSEYLVRNKETFYGVRRANGKYMLIPESAAKSMRKPYMIYIRERFANTKPKKTLHQFYDSNKMLMSQYYENGAKSNQMPENETLKKYINMAIERYTGASRARKQKKTTIPVNRVVNASVVENLLKNITSMQYKQK